MILQWWTEFLSWISTILSFLGNFLIGPGVSFLAFILACSIISMMIATFISKGHE